MFGTTIHISSLEHNEIVNEFDNVLAKKKYACFYSTDIEKALNAGNNANDHYLLAMPFNKNVHWFLLRETSVQAETIDLDILDKQFITGNRGIIKNIRLTKNERGLLDNTEYNFFSDISRDDSDLKIINGVRKNSMGDYTFSRSYENVFIITPNSTNAKF